MLSINADLNLKWRFGGQQRDDFHFFSSEAKCFLRHLPATITRLASGSLYNDQSETQTAVHRICSVNKYI